MFYAFHNAYGNGTTNTYGERVGTLHVFKTKRDRDEWVEDDRFDGNWHREAITHRDARREMKGAYLFETGRNPNECGIADRAEALAHMDDIRLVQFH